MIRPQYRFLQRSGEAELGTDDTFTEIRLRIALPIEDSNFTTTAVDCTYCGAMGWVVFSIGPGESVRFTEKVSGKIYALDEDTFLIGGTWGSTLFPHFLTIDSILPLFLSDCSASRLAPAGVQRLSSSLPTGHRSSSDPLKDHGSNG
jgi:hypothetical protein